MILLMNSFLLLYQHLNPINFIIDMLQDEQVLPFLIPINRKKTIVASQIQEPEKNSPVKKQLKVEQRSQRQKQSPIKDRKVNDKEVKHVGPKPFNKIEEYNQRFKSMNEEVRKKAEQEKIKVTEKWKEAEKARALIDQMMHKINAKNVSEQLYPVTNEDIEAYMKQADQQISKLNFELQRKQNSLSLNPKNLNLKEEVQNLKSSINRAVNIKQLYQDKINQRNKITNLERTNLSLREENNNLRIKINRGIETIQKHMHNLPCEKEKQLLQELDSIKIKYGKEKVMREKLEENISEIVLNFKRLYEEADTARLIVTKKLKELEEKERGINASAPHYSNDSKGSQHNGPLGSSMEEKAGKSLKIGQIKNISPILTNNRTPPKQINQPQDKITTVSKSKLVPGQKVLSGMFSLQEQIKKMRNNQHTLIKHK